MFAWQAFLTVELAPHPLNQFSKTATLDPRSVCDCLPIQLWDSPAALPALSQQPLWSSETPPARSHALSNSRTPGSRLVPKGSSRVFSSYVWVSDFHRPGNPVLTWKGQRKQSRWPCPHCSHPGIVTCPVPGRQPALLPRVQRGQSLAWTDRAKSTGKDCRGLSSGWNVSKDPETPGELEIPARG